MIRRQPVPLSEPIRDTEIILNRTPCLVFVVDPATEDLLFINEASRLHFITESDTPPAGETLYETIQSFCRERHITDNLLQQKSIYFELSLAGNDSAWLGIQCSIIPWHDSRDVRLYTCIDISAEKRHAEYTKSVSHLDYLTGLPNRYRCDIDLEHAVHAARKNNAFGYFLFIDMDDFKIINDGYGHDLGDALLVEFSDYLKKTCLPGNRVFRFGGDEFVILVSPANAHRIDFIVDDLLKRSRHPWHVIEKLFYCTVSIGIVRFPDGSKNIKDIIKNADVALYEAKKLGKNSYANYSDRMVNTSVERAEMESMMRSAITQNFAGFTVCFHPWVNAGTGDIVGAEALLRWYTSSDQLIMPDEFIALAEYLGLIVPLGDFVLRESCKQLRQINESGLPDFTISVNVSMRQLLQTEMIHSITEILSDTGVNPHNLILEITEGHAAIDFQHILEICNRLRVLGIKEALDDFGTGYSSLSNMRDIPADVIKIDRSFIQNVLSDPYFYSFIHLITELCHSMNKIVCIEGVETLEQLNRCLEAQADIIQGFHFYLPMTGEQLSQELRFHQERLIP